MKRRPTGTFDDDEMELDNIRNLLDDLSKKILNHRRDSQVVEESHDFEESTISRKSATVSFLTKHIASLNIIFKGITIRIQQEAMAKNRSTGLDSDLEEEVSTSVS